MTNNMNEIAVQLASIIREKKRIDEEEKNLRNKLYQMMKDSSVDSFSITNARFTQVCASEDKEVFDLNKFQNEMPANYASLFEQFHKTQKGKSAFLKCEVL